MGRPFVRALVTASWLERTPGARGRRRRAARTKRIIATEKNNNVCGLLSSPLQTNKRITPHRPTTEAGFRSTVPFSRSGMRLFNVRFGLQRFALKTDHVIPKSDVEPMIEPQIEHNKAVNWTSRPRPLGFSRRLPRTLVESVCRCGWWYALVRG